MSLDMIGWIFIGAVIWGALFYAIARVGAGLL